MNWFPWSKSDKSYKIEQGLTFAKKCIRQDRKSSLDAYLELERKVSEKPCLISYDELLDIADKIQPALSMTRSIRNMADTIDYGKK